MRRNRGRADEFERLQRQLAVLAENTVFRPVAEEIRQAMEFVVAAKNAGFSEADVINQCAAVSLRALRKLPPVEHVTDRFLFDVYLIQTLAAPWRKSSLGVPSLIVPNYERPWSHQRVPLAPAISDRNPCVDVIGFRGTAALEDIDLLNYPWLIHELGHSAFTANNGIFVAATAEVCRVAIAQRRARTVLLQGAARNRARSVADTMKDLWGPHTDRNSWALEIGTDLFAAWTGGPAYGAAFLDYVSDVAVDPFKIDANHPPYFIRTCALEEGIRRLGWTQTADNLATLISRWNRQTQERSSVLELSDTEMLGQLVYGLLDMLEQSGVDRCTTADVELAQSRFRDTDAVDFGMCLMLDAYVAHESLTESEYGQWHERTVRHLAEQLTQ